MIYTVTLNPALDYVLSVPEAGDEPACRADAAALLPGGKGVNVSLMLRRLEVPSVPTGLCAGVTGRCLLDRLTEAGLEPDFVLLNPDAAPDAGTRINVKLREARPGGVPALREINTAGAPVTAEALEALATRLARRLHRLQPDDLLVLAGSIPPGLGSGAYVQLLSRLSAGAAGRVRVAADTAGAGMAALLPLRPWLIKPNRAELSALSGIQADSDSAVLRAARNLQAAGAGHVLVTLGGGRYAAGARPAGRGGRSWRGLPAHRRRTRQGAVLGGSRRRLACRLSGGVAAGMEAGKRTALCRRLRRSRRLFARRNGQPCRGGTPVCADGAGRSGGAASPGAVTAP